MLLNFCVHVALSILSAEFVKKQNKTNTFLNIKLPSSTYLSLFGMDFVEKGAVNSCSTVCFRHKEWHLGQFIVFHTHRQTSEKDFFFFFFFEHLKNVFTHK